MATASSASRTWRAFASASEWTATVRIPRRRAVRMTRQAISPRFAIRIFSNMGSSHPEDAEARLGDRGVQGGGEGEPEHPARLGRVHDPVVPQPGGRVVGVTLR